MVAAHSIARPPAAPDSDQRIVLNGVSWRDYLLLSDLFIDRPGLHLTYLEGTLEIMTTSPRHERIKTLIGRLLELHALVHRIPIIGFGSATYRREERERGLEPDECYCVGAEKEYPDLAIEVVLTSGGLDKLAVYEGLGVREVWFWQNGAFHVFSLAATGYAEVQASALFPAMRFERLAELVAMPDQDQAVRLYFDELNAAKR
jgi:Uma2 family endonuclease